MRAVIQRVKEASVEVENEIIGKINKGLVVLLGVGKEDDEADVQYLIEKIINLRIFEDEKGKMNKSVKDVNGALLVISQFTLLGDVRKGRRPSFTHAAPPETAEKLYEIFIKRCREKNIEVQTGKFQADMLVRIANDGPVTILVDSKKQF